MRGAIATSIALLVLSATANGQAARIDAASLQAGARAGILAPTAGSKYELTTVKMDASTGSHSHVWRGAGIGFLVGAAGGAALGAATISGCCDKDARELRVLGIVANGLLGGAIGGLVGAFIGSRQHTKDPVPVTP